MTLTLEQVRQTRFHLARRNGYEPVDVDAFVDKVEATLSQLTEENATLKQQVEALSSSEPSSIFVPGDSAEADQLKSDLRGRQAELEGAKGELAGKLEELGQRTQELEQARSELASAQAELDALRGQVAQLQQQAAAPEEAPSTPLGKVENIVVTSSAEASPAVTRLLQMATEQAERLVGESQVEAQRIVSSARAEAESVIDNANKKAHETLTDARTRADRIESEARVNAERVTNDAQSRADAVNGEADARRAELFTALEQERDVLRGKVDHLRSFEASFRNNMASHLQSQIKALTEAAIEPGDTPAILDEPAPESATPRLDALLNEGN
ncbi:Cell wall synthesis protein Wag31 [Propionicimonas sp. T2.31MG-18]|uniref:DivIVA domain-containing protein n=1 Tax=Propionicimonas sp. T2.31MG-18 TaxID=3157620 RepID=UPI0035E75F52